MPIVNCVRLHAALILGLVRLTSAVAQQDPGTLRFTLQACPTQQSLRGLCVVDEQTAWASGSGNAVVRTADGGKNWIAVSVPGHEFVQFRDIQAWSDQEAIVLGAGSPAVIYRTQDGGRTWLEAHRDARPEVFFNAMGFWDRMHGLAFSDPIDGKLVLLQTNDGGATWTQLPLQQRPATLAREAGFAASGTSLTVRGPNSVWIGLGGESVEGEPSTAGVLFSHDRGATWQTARTELPRSASAGVFSLVMIDDRVGVAVGGDYQAPEATTGNIVRTKDGGAVWRSVSGPPPSGYRSAVAVAAPPGREVLVATGTNGTDISLDRGKSWRRRSSEGFHAVAFAPASGLGWAVGDQGRVARLSWTSN